MIYVASSWRNERHGEVVTALREAKLEVYDFKEPSTCFKWSEVSPIDEHGGVITAAEYLSALGNPIAYRGVRQDFDALERCNSLILVLSCGNSAHAEFGYATGRNKPTAILLDDPVRDMDLMHLMCNTFYTKLDLLVQWAVKAERLDGLKRWR